MEKQAESRCGEPRDIRGEPRTETRVPSPESRVLGPDSRCVAATCELHRHFEAGLTPETDRMPLDEGIKQALPEASIR